MAPLLALVACGEKDDSGSTDGGTTDGGAADGGAADGGAADGGGSGETCDETIPSSAVPVSSEVTDNTGGATYEVCSGGSLISNAGSVTAYVRSGASAIFNAGNSTVWAEAGAEIIVNAGSVTIMGNPDDVILNATSGVTWDECIVTLSGGGC